MICLFLANFLSNMCDRFNYTPDACQQTQFELYIKFEDTHTYTHTHIHTHTHIYIYSSIKRSHDVQYYIHTDDTFLLI